MVSDKGGSIGSYEVRELGRNSGTRILGAADLDATGCRRGSELDNPGPRGILSPPEAMRGEDCLISS